MGLLAIPSWKGSDMAPGLSHQREVWMKRRGFFALLGGAAATLSRVARAQPTATPVIGFLGSGFPDDQVNLVAATRDGLKDAGFIEGKNLTIEYRWAQGNYDRVTAAGCSRFMISTRRHRIAPISWRRYPNRY